MYFEHHRVLGYTPTHNKKFPELSACGHEPFLKLGGESLIFQQKLDYNWMTKFV